jgi:hypothetical protein
VLQSNGINLQKQWGLTNQQKYVILMSTNETIQNEWLFYSRGKEVSHE